MAFKETEFRENSYLIRTVTLHTKGEGQKEFEGKELPRVLRKFGKELKKRGSPVGSVTLSISEMHGPEGSRSPRIQKHDVIISDSDGQLYFTLQTRLGESSDLK